MYYVDIKDRNPESKVKPSIYSTENLKKTYSI